MADETKQIIKGTNSCIDESCGPVLRMPLFFSRWKLLPSFTSCFWWIHFKVQFPRINPTWRNSSWIQHKNPIRSLSCQPTCPNFDDMALWKCILFDGFSNEFYSTLPCRGDFRAPCLMTVEGISYKYAMNLPPIWKDYSIKYLYDIPLTSTFPIDDSGGYLETVALAAPPFQGGEIPKVNIQVFPTCLYIHYILYIPMKSHDIHIIFAWNHYINLHHCIPLNHMNSYQIHMVFQWNFMENQWKPY